MRMTTSLSGFLLREGEDISPEKLEKMLEKSHINGGDIMPTLAQRWVEQGFEKGIEKGCAREKYRDCQKVDKERH